MLQRIEEKSEDIGVFCSDSGKEKFSTLLEKLSKRKKKKGESSRADIKQKD